MGVLVEICVDGVASVRAAEAGGADRVELCANLPAGGITPSAGAIELACRPARIPVHVLIRPRPGDFCYTELEYAVMRRDIEVAKSFGASGVVVGLLDTAGRVDRARTAALVAAARPLSVTFHKAFDACVDPHEALETLVALGVERVLTSGRQPGAFEGIDLLAELVRRAAERIAVMAGGRIVESEIAPLIAAGIREVHLGSAVVEEGETRAGKVRRIVELARSRGETETR